MQQINPILRMDYPDPDVIRVGDVYYMVSTTMYFFPGGVILRSYDLVHWEIVTYLFDKLDDTPGERLEKEMVDYAGGMWAPCLRYHNGSFYVMFASHTDGGRTYLFSASKIEGPWERRVYNKYYHDCSLLFDDDGRVYMTYGNSDIHLLELSPDLSGPKEGGLSRIIIQEKEDRRLGYEGSHIYKRNGYYYVFLIHWPKVGMRTQACFRSDSLTGTFEGRDILQDDRGFFEQGVAQGGMVDTPAGDWYSVLFQDTGAVGRIPVLIPLHFEKEWPVYGENGRIPEEFPIPLPEKAYAYEALYTSDTFPYVQRENGEFFLKPQWQWNHQMNPKLWKLLSEGGLSIRTDRISINVTHAKNCLTQRMLYPRCGAEVTVDGSGLNDGDVAGICGLQSCYGYLGITKSAGEYFLIKVVRTPEKLKHSPRTGDCMPGELIEKIRLSKPVVRVCLKTDFENLKDEMDFFYEENGKLLKVGTSHRLFYRLDHFTGYRFGLFIFSTRETGGEAVFTDFSYLTE